MSRLKTYSDEVLAFCRVCQSLAADTYVTGTGGNLAWKLEDDLILITPTRVNKGDIGPDDVVFIDMKGETVEGGLKPTGEKPMYLKFFADRPDIVSVLHCHPPHVCAFAISEGKNWLERPVFPEACIEVGPAPIVPYAEPLTEELANNFAPFLPKYNSFIMESHGLVTMSRGSITWTHMNVELLETSAKSILMALDLGGVKEISKVEVEGLDGVMKARELPLFGAEGVNKSLVEMYYPE